MFKKILVANRGEIALRVINTCRDMGVKTVAVYSDADKKAMHVLAADEAVYLGPSEPSQSYLHMDKIIDAAKTTGAEAIHPGYGFLAENSEFVEKCEQQSVVFIGPPAKVIKDLGDKITSRKIMVNSGVPVTPGLTSTEADADVMIVEAEKVGYPVLIKATAGGGGKGIRIVNSSEEMADACSAASREAVNAFGNGEIYLEKFFTKARHIEFQVLADKFGNTIHLLERECSVQRRHQKIIEETPSSVLTPALREEMGKAAVTAARASGYVNAGTVEFLLDENNNFYFLEVNTRLQVEHPVTEMITGVDLVRLQLEIAYGQELTISQEDIAGRGHSIECRIYAEDPENDFFPSPGTITFLKEPTGPGIRNDCGVYSGFEVPVDYDPILSKLIVHAQTREHAINKMIKALKSYIVLGVKTPIDFLIDVLQSEPFVQGEVFTDFIETHFSDWKPDMSDADLARIAFVVDEMCSNRKAKRVASAEDAIPTPWQTLGNWRQGG
ncbi:MAG: acetyl-CoA carboxylase biotin carboxylase subunit [Desulfobacteraceae bacterium]|nr:acetyl-CoA carboxylase biotin carboxylase subunit [Desulfobacteraceae bacterium]MBC2756966.1 acetyl-CoA carboxylase biotin carboxylase subunit [Desulfobacteraceae bacterium]